MSKKFLLIRKESCFFDEGSTRPARWRLCFITSLAGRRDNARWMSTSGLSCATGICTVRCRLEHGRGLIILLCFCGVFLRALLAEIDREIEGGDDVHGSGIDIGDAIVLKGCEHLPLLERERQLRAG